MCGLFNLNVWDDDAQYLVLDDIGFEYIGGFRKALWGAQKELTLSDKFLRKRSVKWNKPTIFIGNEGDDMRLLPCDGKVLKNLADREWYCENAVFVEVRNPLFRVRAAPVAGH